MERGSGTLLMGLAVAGAAIVLAIGMAVGVMRATALRVAGAADLVAVAGAQAQLRAHPACAAAQRAAAANEVILESCRVEGDEVEFVVSVTVRAARATYGGTMRAAAHAGVVTGAPE